MKKKRLIYPCLLLLPIITNTAYGDAKLQEVNATSATRAGEIKTWREQCNDPDYDLRLAYLEQALKSKDVTIERICIKAALESDNAEIKNLGLRAAVSATDKIYFSANLPEIIEKEISVAGDNEDKIRKVKDSYEFRDYQWIKQGFIFYIQSASISKGDSEWYPLVKNSKPYDKTTKANVIGDKIKWSGEMDFDGGRTCDLNVSLATGVSLVGTLQCQDWVPYPVSAKLL